ncbi:hypothetical protein [Streptomyces sp. NPDC055607]
MSLDGPAARPLTDAEAEAQADQLIREAFYRDDTPLPCVGTTPPVAQPGRPPMSQRATDITGIMTAAGLSSVPLSLSACALLWTAGQLDPLTLGLFVGSPVALTLAISRVLRRAKDTVAAAPPVHHHHYNREVHQETTTVSNTTKGLINKNHSNVR